MIFLTTEGRWLSWAKKKWAKMKLNFPRNKSLTEPSSLFKHKKFFFLIHLVKIKNINSLFEFNYAFRRWSNIFSLIHWTSIKSSVKFWPILMNHKSHKENDNDFTQPKKSRKIFIYVNNNITINKKQFSVNERQFSRRKTLGIPGRCPNTSPRAHRPLDRNDR